MSWIIVGNCQDISDISVPGVSRVTVIMNIDFIIIAIVEISPMALVGYAVSIHLTYFEIWESPLISSVLSYEFNNYE